MDATTKFLETTELNGPNSIPHNFRVNLRKQPPNPLVMQIKHWIFLWPLQLNKSAWLLVSDIQPQLWNAFSTIHWKKQYSA